MSQFAKLAEITLKTLLIAIEGCEPVPDNLQKYLNKLDLPEIRRYFFEYEKFSPIIVEVNSKMYVFDSKFFADEHGKLPALEENYINIKTIPK